jgi:hypothetical protein
MRKQTKDCPETFSYLGRSLDIVLVLLIVPITVQACATNDASRVQKNTQIENYVSDELLVLYREGTTQSKINEINESVGVQPLRKMLSGRVNLVRVPTDRSLQEVRSAYSSFPEVEAVDLNYRIGPQRAPSRSY